MHSVQPPLLPFNEFLRLDHSDRLLVVLEALDAESLLRALTRGPRQGRRGHSPRVLWAALIAGVVYGIPTVAELRRHLATNPRLRFLCNIPSLAAIPSAATFSRFLARLAQHQPLLDACFTRLLQRLRERLPDLGGRVLALDSTDVHAWANGRRRKPADPDASWSAKGGGGPSGQDKYWWFGYKVHLLVDAIHELPLALTVTTAKAYDGHQVEPLLHQAEARLGNLVPGAVAADAGYDARPVYEAIDGLGAAPIIPLISHPGESPPGITNLQGTALCPRGHPMLYWGRDGPWLKYRCPKALGQHACSPRSGHGPCSTSPYGLVVKLSYRQDLRRTPPVPRETRKWRRLYRRRTAVERVFSRLKSHLLLDALRVRGLVKVRVRVTLSTLVLLAAALGMAQRQRWRELRTLVA